MKKKKTGRSQNTDGLVVMIFQPRNHAHPPVIMNVLLEALLQMYFSIYIYIYIERERERERNVNKSDGMYI